MSTHTETKNTPQAKLSSRAGRRLGGFTLIELLVSLSILASVSIVAYVSYAGHLKISHNTTRKETIDSLHLSLSDYYEQKKVLPDPNSNYISYDAQGTYMHSLSGAYGISGHVSNDFLPSGYVNFQATDPESNQYYGYGKMFGSSSKNGKDAGDAKFDLAAVLYDDTTGGYKTYLRGTYEKVRLASLIRSYSSSNFVSQDSTEELPYNPYERKITAHVSNYSGSLTITAANGAIILLVSPLSFTGELNSGDRVTLSTGSTALLHISDGSELSLGSTGSQTELVLSSLAYQDDNNLVSRVALLLNMGEVWTEAPHLRSEAEEASDFSVQTDSAVAAVRGTVFGVAKDPAGKTSLLLASGKIEVGKIDTGGHISAFTAGFDTNPNSTGGFMLSDSKSYMNVPDEGTPIRLDGITNVADVGGIPPTSTGTISSSEVDQKLQHPRFSLGYRPVADKISFTTGGLLTVELDNPGADSYELYFGTGRTDTTQAFPVPDDTPSQTGILSGLGPVTLTGTFPSLTDPTLPDRVYSLKICFQGKCSAPHVIGLPPPPFSVGPFHVWGEKAKCSFGQKPFAAFGCEDQSLVAFAPFDVPGDVFLRDQSDAVFPIETRDIVSSHAGVMTATGTKGPAAIAAAQAWPGYGNLTRLPNFEKSPKWFTSWVELDGNYGTELDGDVERMGLVRFSAGFTHYELDGEKRGININSSSGSSYDCGDHPCKGSLKYDLSSLNLTDNYSIEFSVRGAALNRTGGPFYLMSNSGASLKMFKASTFLRTAGLPDINIWSIIPVLQSNDFYIVQFKKSGWLNSLAILSQWGVYLTGTTSTGSLGNPDSSTYIGSTNLQNNQWNDIIDSVKIRKY